MSYILPKYDVPILPFYINCFYGPQPTANRVYQIGRSVRAIIEDFDKDVKDVNKGMDMIDESLDKVNCKERYITEGNHDDLVMTLVLFSWMTTQRYFKDLLDQDLRVKLFEEKMRQLEEEVLPIGFLDDGLGEDIFIDSEGDRWTVVAEYDNIHSAL